MHFVLVVITMLAPDSAVSRATQGPVVSMQEFDSRDACNLAQGLIRKSIPQAQNVFCVPKGDEK